MAYAASAIAPITGRFGRRVIRDLVGSITVGLGAAYYFWYADHLPKMERYKAYDQQVRAEILKEHGAWSIGPGQQEKLDQIRGEKAPGQTVA